MNIVLCVACVGLLICSIIIWITNKNLEKVRYDREASLKMGRDNERSVIEAGLRGENKQKEEE